MPERRAESGPTGELRCCKRSSSDLLPKCWTLGDEYASASQATWASGGERSLIWRAVSRSITTIGPPHSGQVQNGADWPGESE